MEIKNNLNALPALLSWNGGFCFARIKKLRRRRWMFELRRFVKENNVLAIRCWRVMDNSLKTQKLQWTLYLPVRTATAAIMIVADLAAQWEYHRNVCARGAGQGGHPSLTESQMLFLGKQYPRVATLMKSLSEPPANQEVNFLGKELRQAFVEETFACTKVLLEPVFDEEQLLRMARKFKQMNSRERKPDPFEYELIVGWYAKGYCRLTAPELQEALRKNLGHTITIAALAKKTKRLRLPSGTRRGRPPKPKPDLSVLKKRDVS
jgi:hypothetical protein